MALTTSAEIINRALDKIGHGPPLSETSRVGLLTARMYPISLDMALRTFPWNFAQKRLNIVADGTAPLWGYSKAFTLPADFIRLLEVHHVEDYKIEGGKILANADTIDILYVYKITDVAKFDPLFIEYLASTMAVEMCETLTQSNSKKQLLLQEKMLNFQQAKRVDVVGHPVAVDDNDSWLNARL